MDIAKLPPLPPEVLEAYMRVGTPPPPAIDVEVEGEIDQLILTTPTNPEYSGECYGVKFHEGSAIVSRYRKHKFGYPVNRLAWLFLHDAPGVYEVKIVYAAKGEAVSDPMAIPAGEVEATPQPPDSFNRGSIGGQPVEAAPRKSKK